MLRTFCVRIKLLRLAVILFASVTLIAGCGKVISIKKVSAETSLHAVRVSSKVGTENTLLGNMILQMLNANGIPTENKLQLGISKVTRVAILSGDIDIYPEYTGNGAFMFNDETNPAWRNFKAGYELVKKFDYDKNKIVWLQPCPANNAWAIAVRSDVVEANHLKSLSDLKPWLARGGIFKLASSSGFVERVDGLSMFERTYGFKLKQDQLLLLAGADTSPFIKAAVQRSSGVNAALVYATDGGIEQQGMVVLEDPKNMQPIYAPTPIVREETLKRYPQIAKILNPVFASLDTKTLQRLNTEVTIEGKGSEEVATKYLKSKGFIQ